MKKFVALILALTLLVSLTACSGTPATTSAPAETTQATVAETTAASLALDRTWPEETVKIGVETYDVTAAQFLQMQAYYEYLAKSFNIEFVYSESIANAEDELKFVENCAASGVKAIIGYYNVSQAEVVQLCADKGIYYWGGADNPGIYDPFSKNEFYLGSYDNGDGDFQAGYDMATSLAAQDVHKVVYVSGGDEMGIPQFIKRAAGFEAGIKDAVAAGKTIEVIHKVPGWPGTDSFAAEQSNVSNMDFDGLATSFTAAVWFQPLSVAGKLDKIKIATIGSVDDMYLDLAKAGIVSAIVYDCEELQFGSAIPLILNAVSGNAAATRNAEGLAAKHAVPRWLVDSADKYQAIYDVHKAGNWFVTAEDVANMLVAYNPDASYATFDQYYAAMDVASALASVK